MPRIENPCEECRFYVGKLREATYSMKRHGDIAGLGAWEFYLGKMLELPFLDDEAESIRKMLCTNCLTLSIYDRVYIRDLRQRITKTDEGMQALDDKSKAFVVTACAPVLDKISNGQKILFDVVYKGAGSGRETGLKPD
jgi:hypothetical protein